MKYPTLRQCLRYMLEHDKTLTQQEAIEANAEFARVVPMLRDRRAVELELSRLPRSTLRKACTTEEGTVPLSYAANRVLEEISNCIYCPEDPDYDPAAEAFMLGLFCGYYQSDYESHDGFAHFHNCVPCAYEAQFFDGYMQTRKYGHDAYLQGIAHHSEVMVVKDEAARRAAIDEYNRLVVKGLL